MSGAGTELNVRMIAAKERWAQKQKTRGVRADAVPSADRLPPGQRLTTGFPVLDLGVHPEFDPAQWSLTVDGLVGKSQTWNWDAFNRLPKVTDTSDMHCVTTWSKFDCVWEGVAFTSIFEAVQPHPEARFVWFEGSDDFTVNVPLVALLDDDVLLATHFEGAPLTVEHGGPLRVIVPKLYAWKGAKWVRRIHFMAEDRLGFWENRGYSNTADPFTNDRYS